ncbi:hypothetical protein KI387_039740, partial [Taxus chinensis]
IERHPTGVGSDVDHVDGILQKNLEGSEEEVAELHEYKWPVCRPRWRRERVEEMEDRMETEM